ncbi:unnamed protein product, partial [Tenebrio molitor]
MFPTVAFHLAVDSCHGHSKTFFRGYGIEDVAERNLRTQKVPPQGVGQQVRTHPFRLDLKQDCC